jgi:hypothetical protein
MKAAQQADTSTLKSAILGLTKAHATRLGYSLDLGLRKDQRGINDSGTACLFLPRGHLDDYCFNPKE